LLPAAVLAAVATGCSGGAGTVELNGQGATFVEPVMKVWTNHYLEEKTAGRVRINYQGTGSGAGIQQLTNKTTDFGCSDAPMNRKQFDAATEAGGPVVHVPLVIGAVVPTYNLDGVTQPLNFTGAVLADIYLGKVTKWNDPALKELNPGVDLPDLGIQPVFRSDSSGTSNVFTEYLSKVSPEFKAKVGASTSPAFPQGVGIGKPKTDGVAGHVANTPGAIGYVELTYALDKKAQYGAVRNRAGTFVRADLAGITAAAAASLAEKPVDEPYALHDLTYSLTDPAGAGSYPIAAMSYAVLYAHQPDAAKGKAVVEFLTWCASAEGQKMAERRNYAALPPDLAAKVAAKLGTIRVGP
jgi:phosphate transport system substrate-binding protein